MLRIYPLLLQTENGVLLPSLQSALPFLDLHGTPRLEFHQSVFDELRDKLLERVSAIASEGKAEERWVSTRKLLIFVSSIYGLHGCTALLVDTTWNVFEGFLFSVCSVCGDPLLQLCKSVQVQEAGRPSGKELFLGQDAIPSTSGDVCYETLAQGEHCGASPPRLWV